MIPGQIASPMTRSNLEWQTPSGWVTDVMEASIKRGIGPPSPGLWVVQYLFPWPGSFMTLALLNGPEDIHSSLFTHSAHKTARVTIPLGRCKVQTWELLTTKGLTGFARIKKNWHWCMSWLEGSSGQCRGIWIRIDWHFIGTAATSYPIIIVIDNSHCNHYHEAFDEAVCHECGCALHWPHTVKPFQQKCTL